MAEGIWYHVNSSVLTWLFDTYRDGWMKRFILLVLLLVFAGGFFLQLIYHRTPAGDPLLLVGADAALVVDCADPARLGRQIIDSRMGRNMTSVDWPYVLNQLDLSVSLRKNLQLQVPALLDWVASPLCRAIFGKQVILALLPVEPTRVFGKKPSVPENNILLVASPRKEYIPSAVFTSLARFQGKVKHLSYRKRRITSLSLENGEIVHYAFVDGNLVASPGLRTIERTIDLSLSHVIDEQSGMVTNVQYRSLRKRYKGDDFFIYVDLPRLCPLLTSGKHVAKAGILAEVLLKRGIQRAAFFHATDQQSQHLISIFQWDTNHQTTEYKTSLPGRQPSTNRWLQFIPAHIVLYFWTNWLDVSRWWQHLEPPESELSAGKNRLTDSITSWIRQHTDLDMDAFLALFGRELGVTVTGIKTSGFFPVPSMYAVIQLKDRQQVAELLEKNIADLSLRHDMISGVPVVSVMIAGGLMQPSYALLDDTLLVADSREQIKDLLDVAVPHLLDDPFFKKVDTGMTRPANLHFFARTSAIIDSLKELASWVSMVIAVRDGVAGKKSKVVVDHVLLPFLDGFKTFQAKSIRGYTSPGEVVFDAVVLTSSETE